MNEENIELTKIPNSIDTMEQSVDNTSVDLVDESNRSAFKFLNMKSQINDIQRINDAIKNKTKEYINTDDDDKFFDSIAMSLSINDLKALTDEEVKNIYDNETHPIKISIDFNGDTKKEIDFKRSLLVFRHQSLESIAVFETKLAELKDEIAKSQEEFDAACAEFGNVSNLIRTTLEKKIDSATNEHEKELYSLIQEYFGYGSSLENLKKYVSSYRGKSIIGDYRNEKKTMYVYRTYKKLIASFGIKTNLGDNIFADIEHRFIDGDEYNIRPNIFMFAVMHYIASWNNKDVDKAYGVFITEFTINMKNLIYDKFDTPENKEIFINNIKEVIKLIG